MTLPFAMPSADLFFAVPRRTFAQGSTAGTLDMTYWSGSFP